MKKTLCALTVLLAAFLLRLPAFADIPAIPRPDNNSTAQSNPLIPIAIALVIIIAVILVKLLRSRKK